jgi:peptidoglycan biosynthesis protein MviN/MurJ (putative lipid II flippase)
MPCNQVRSMTESTQRQQIARQATIVSVGNILSRIMGLIREMTIANIYGASGAVSAFQAASDVPRNLYELLVGGMVSSALIPTLSEYATPQKRDELGRLVGMLLSLALLVLGTVLLILELGAPLVSRALVQFDAPLQAETTRLLRIMLTSVLFLGLSGLATAVCHSLQRFTLPAFTAAFFNASVVLFALLLGPRWVREVQNPGLDDIWVGDTVSGTTDLQADQTLLARTLVVAIPGTGQEPILGIVAGIEGQALHLEGKEGPIQILVDEQTRFSVTRRQVSALAIGLVVGAVLQVLLQLPALRDINIRLTLDLHHPSLRQILRLYLPVVLSLGVASVGIIIDRNLASRTGELSISWMAVATRLIQFPLGLISMAISTAILPALAGLAAQEAGGEGGTPGDSGPFRATLATGLRLVLVLVIPAVVGLFVLAHPLVALLFQHGEFGPYDTVQTARALRLYLIGLLPAAIDQPLIFAFYARKDTWRPAMVGILGVVFYLVVALPTFRTLGMAGLILANGAQLAGHAAVMWVLLHRHVGSLRGHRIWQTGLRALFAAVLMGAVVWAASKGAEVLSPSPGRMQWGLAAALGGGLGAAVYLSICALLRVPEVQMIWALVHRVVRRLQPRPEPHRPGSQ